jgi:cation diffusion facilitator family transporter
MTDPPHVPVGARSQAVLRVVRVEFTLNVLLAAVKAAYGFWSGSLVVATDAVHSLLDAGSNVIAVCALRAADAPPDEGHPYGHRKYEIIAAAAVGVVIAVGVFKFGWAALQALVTGQRAIATPPVGFVVVGGTWVVNIFVAWWEAKKGRELNSAFLLADAGHTASDVIVTGAVMASLTAAYYGAGWADPVGALFVLILVAGVAWQILKRNVDILVDSAAVDADRVHTVALAVPGVAGCHRVRSRGTELHAHLDLHLLIDGDIPLRAAHDIAHRVEDDLRREFPEIRDVTIHMEPDDDGHEGL